MIDMRFNLDLDLEELRMLRLVLHNQPFDGLQELVDKLNRFYEIAQTAEGAGLK